MGLDTQIQAFSLTRRMEPAPLQTEKAGHCLAPRLLPGSCFLPGSRASGDVSLLRPADRGTLSRGEHVMWGGEAQVRECSLLPQTSPGTSSWAAHPQTVRKVTSFKLSTEHCEGNEFASFLSAYNLNICAGKFSSIQNLSIRDLLFISIGPDPREDTCVWDLGPALRFPVLRWQRHMQNTV